MNKNQLDPVPPNQDGSTSCIVQWFIETSSGWLGAWDKGAFDAFASAIREQERAEWVSVVQHVIDELEPIDDETSQSCAATLRNLIELHSE